MATCSCLKLLRKGEETFRYYYKGLTTAEFCGIISLILIMQCNSTGCNKFNLDFSERKIRTIVRSTCPIKQNTLVLTWKGCWNNSIVLMLQSAYPLKQRNHLALNCFYSRVSVRPYTMRQSFSCQSNNYWRNTCGNIP